MYETFFKFRTRPFSPVPQPKNYFPTEVCENARRSLERAIERGEGPGLIIGPPGTGKSLVCHLLAEKFRGPYAVSLLTGGRLKSCQALLQQVHYELGLEYRGLDEGELRLSLIDFLEPAADGPEALLLIVDEAHALPFRLLDEVRLLTNLIRDGQSRVRVVLAGGPVLEERFASPKLQSFAQRIAARCYLEPLNRAETYDYVRAQFTRAGGNPAQVIDDEALQSVYRATDGIPRLINQICDHALVLASLGGVSKLTAEVIDEAWADLQQLPMPWTPGAVCEDGGNAIVEFGHLRDEGDSPESIPLRYEERSSATLPLLRTVRPAEGNPSFNDAPVVQAEPEVDLDFPEFGDPFSEEFAEEELVLNQYAADVEIFADVPRVSSWEGRQIGAMLDTQQAQAHSTENDLDEMEIVFPAATIATFSALQDPVLPDDAEEPLDGEAARELPLPVLKEQKHPAPATPVPAARIEPAAEVKPVVLPPAERTKIVIEEAPAQRPGQPAKPRPSEFRQLFSKLRRG
jgi:type II secretory pathway predicted ATPase ExeA